MWRLLLALLVFLGALSIFRKKVPKGESRAAPPKGEPQPMVRDSSCGAFIPRDRALTATIGGEEHHFCSSACRDAFLKEKG
jgi:hypothetical protein